MKKSIEFQTHVYAPELNSAYINGCLIPDYTPKAGDYETMIKDLRVWLKPKKHFIRITIEHTGATSRLGVESFNVGTTMKRFFLTWLRSKSSGEAEFLNDKGKYELKKYGYKIINVKGIN